jgi:hypothetical protein
VAVAVISVVGWVVKMIVIEVSKPSASAENRLAKSNSLGELVLPRSIQSEIGKSSSAEEGPYFPGTPGKYPVVSHHQAQLARIA